MLGRAVEVYPGRLGSGHLAAGEGDVMTNTTATPLPLSACVREEAKALVSSVTFTVIFTAAFAAVAPVVLLGAVLGGPLWAALFPLVHRRA
jgi:hypothetical protein